MSNLEISVAKYDATMCGNLCQYKRLYPQNTYCEAFCKFLQFGTGQKYAGSILSKRCAECLAYQPVKATGDKP